MSVKPACGRALLAVGAGLLRCNRCGEFHEEIVSGLFGRAVDQTLAELSELAADLRLDVIREKRAAILVAERYLGVTLGKTRDATLAFAHDPIAVGRIEIRELDLSLPARFHWTDLDGGDGLEFRIRVLVEHLASRDADLEHLGVVEHRPYLIARCRELNLSVHGHRHRRRSPLLRCRY